MSVLEDLDVRLRDRQWWWGRVAPLVAWIGLILWVASRPRGFFFAPGALFWGVPRHVIQYPYHVGVFAVLAALFARVRFTERARWVHARERTTVIVGSLLVSLCSEGIQMLVPTRTPALRDVGLDLFGVLIAVVLLRGRGVL